MVWRIYGDQVGQIYGEVAGSDSAGAGTCRGERQPRSVAAAPDGGAAGGQGGRRAAGAGEGGRAGSADACAGECGDSEAAQGSGWGFAAGLGFGDAKGARGLV